jgi:hypothetical protein
MNSSPELLTSALEGYKNEAPTYKASMTIAQFHKSNVFIRAVMGPFGSGKSVGCCMDIFLRSCQQKPQRSSTHNRPVRKTRWAIIRNTYRELIDTTLNTWCDWFPKDEMGHWVASEMKHVIDIPLPDGTQLYMEVLFRALDSPEDIKKLLSLELTGAWMNEARELPKAVFEAIQSRLGRYPSKRDGGPTWHGLILDTNPPDEDHWWYRLFEDERPDNARIFKQPSGLSELAENMDNLVPGYYTNLQKGKDPEWIKVYIHGLYGFVIDGKPVHPGYADDVHTAKDDIPFNSRLPLVLGVDFGLTPAAALLQNYGDGQWVAIDEFVTEDMAAKQFGKALKKYINKNYQGAKIIGWGDPAGKQQAQTDKTTPFDVMNAAGIPIAPAPTNDFMLRVESVDNLLSTLTMSGEPALMISPRCKQLRRGLAGKYEYKRVQIVGDERFQDKPNKNKYSHVCEALQYGLMGEGEDTKMLTSADGIGSLTYGVRRAVGSKTRRSVKRVKPPRRMAQNRNSRRPHDIMD